MTGNIILYNHVQFAVSLLGSPSRQQDNKDSVTTNLEQTVSGDLWAEKRLQNSLSIP